VLRTTLADEGMLPDADSVAGKSGTSEAAAGSNLWVAATAGDQVIARRRRRLDLTTDGLAKCIRYPPILADLRCLFLLSLQ